jgi:hypothetical protein
MLQEVFSVWVRVMPIARQRSCKHASLIETVFSVGSMRRGYLEDNRRYKDEVGSAVECSPADNGS